MTSSEPPIGSRMRPIIIDSPECPATCPDCLTHLSQPVNSCFSKCHSCRMPYRIRKYPCTCPRSIPEDYDAKLFPLDETLLSHTRTEIANSDLTRIRKRILLLVTLVPEGRYTTVSEIKEVMNQHFQITGRKHIFGALEGNLWDDVPVHRVMDCGGLCLSSRQSPAVGGEESRYLLLQEGVRFDKIGRALGAAFRFF